MLAIALFSVFIQSPLDTINLNLGPIRVTLEPSFVAVPALLKHFGIALTSLTALMVTFRIVVRQIWHVKLVCHWFSLSFSRALLPSGFS
ncbi:hypothetical protein FRC08_004050 [Ceratobasidium sp. 394]|nr:hypothetical protein FRC08_004050 [Ceratobasidium sp. 394]